MELPLWASLLISAGLVALSALFSGLSLGLLSLDMTGLKVLQEAGTPAERAAAAKIIPLRKNGNLLLCTLILGNVVVNSFLSILLAGLTSGIIGLIVSTALIVLLGEIFPQAACSRHGLYVGAYTRYVTWFFICLFYPITKPISWTLDCVLGEEMGTSYSRDGLRHLINMHVEGSHTDGILTKDENTLLVGAMEYSAKRVLDVMTTLDRVFMLDAYTKLNFETMLDIYKSGYTRIPVYDGTRDNITGVLYVKDLILVDPDDEVEVQTIVSFRGEKQVRYVLDSMRLNEVFKLFKESHTHLMIAVTLRSGLTGRRLDPGQMTTAPQYVLMQAEKEVTGVITLEDIIEEMIKTEIVDEHDVYTSNEQHERAKKGRNRPDITNFLSLFEHKVRTSTHLTRQEEQAVCAFLLARVKQFEVFADHKAALRALVRNAVLISTEEDSQCDSASDKSVNLEAELVYVRLNSPFDPSLPAVANTPASLSGIAGLGACISVSSLSEYSIVLGSLFDRLKASPGERIGKHRVLYKRREASTDFSLVLQGWVYIWAGSEEFESEMGPWSHMGALAMTQADYVPDFSAVTQEGAHRILQIRAADYKQALSLIQTIESGLPSLAVAIASGQRKVDEGDSPRESHDARKTRPVTPRSTSKRRVSMRSSMRESCAREDPRDTVTLDMPDILVHESGAFPHVAGSRPTTHRSSINENNA